MCVLKRMSVNAQYGSSSDDGPLNGSPVLPSGDEGENYGGEDVSKGAPQRPKHLRSSGTAPKRIILRARGRYFLGEQ